MQQQQQYSTVETLLEEEKTRRSVLDEKVKDIAEQIGEDSRTIKKHKDVTHILERMTDGVVIALHISRPRFAVSIAPKRGGMEFGLEKLGITNSHKAKEIINQYFSLGRHSLLPTELQKELASLENSARACLDRYALRTHWGHFIPTKNYAQWKEENEKYKQSIFEKRDFIIEHYDEIIAQVLGAYGTLAEEVWKQVSFGSVMAQNESDQEDLSSESFEQWHQELTSREKKNAFIQTYITYIQSKIPSRAEIEDAFEYEVELGYIPLPSLLANDIDEAGHVARDRALRDAKLRAELEAIEAQRRADLEVIQNQRRLEDAKQRAEWQKLSEQERADRQIVSFQIKVEEEKLRAEREKIELQRAMDRDVMENARKQKDQLIEEFHTGVIAQINELVKEVCDETLVSLEKHDTLRGPVSARLRNLVKRLKNFNFIEDEKIDSQIKRLEMALPTHVQRDEAKRGNARIETSGIRRVVQQIQQEAEQTLLELDLSPRQRKTRQNLELQTDMIDTTSQPRQSRQSLGWNNNPEIATGYRRSARSI